MASADAERVTFDTLHPHLERRVEDFENKIRDWIASVLSKAKLHEIQDRKTIWTKITQADVPADTFEDVRLADLGSWIVRSCPNVVASMVRHDVLAVTYCADKGSLELSHRDNRNRLDSLVNKQGLSLR